MSAEAEIKYIFLLSRDLTSSEKEELKKFFRVFSFSKKTCFERTAVEILEQYDILCLNIYNSDDKQYYAESIKILEGKEHILKLFIGKLEEDTPEEKESIISSWKIDYFVKKIPKNAKSKEELLHHILCVLLPKPKIKSWKLLIKELVYKGLSYILPKLF